MERRLQLAARRKMQKLADAFTVIQTVTYVAAVIAFTIWVHDYIPATL